jgi:peroxiredoxin
MTKQILIILFFILSYASETDAQESSNNGFLISIGETAPDFSAELSNGTTFRLSENRGKIVMLQFTASWCSVCRKEMPYIEKDIWEKLKREKFVLIGVDRDEPLDIVLKFQEQMNITYPLALDPNADIFGLYADKLSGVTRNVIIDENGKIIYLSRLFKIEEFNEMTEVIFDAVAKL